MKKNEMHEKFRMLLDSRKDLLKRAVDAARETDALVRYGEICGVAEAMRKLDLIDYEETEFIQSEAWSIYQGKEPEYEAC